LSVETEFRGRVHPEGEPPAPGEMGAVTDVLVVALSSGGAITVLLSSITTWLKARRPEVSIEVTSADGSTVRVNAKGQVANKVADALDPPT
jgi:hypothetical protein